MASNEKSNTANDNLALEVPPCLGSVRTSHVVGYYDRKRYLVKKSDFSKTAFAALQGEDRARYFREHADIVKDGEPGDENALEVEHIPQ